MIKYEIKKVFSKTGGKIVIALLLVMVIIVSISAIRSVTSVNVNGESIRGYQASKNLREVKSKWHGYLTEEVFADVIRENAVVEASPEAQSKDYHENNKAYAMKQGFLDLRDIINCAFSPFREYDYYIINELSSEDAKKVYENRILNLQEWLASDEAKDRYSSSQKEFFLNQYRKLKTPLYYEYADGWKALMDSSNTIIMLTMLLLSFLVCNIFPGEYQQKADAIFFSSEEGRKKGVKAKIIAGLTIITSVYWVLVLIYTVIVLFVLGFGGWNCPIQAYFYGWKSLYNITFLEEYLLTILGGYIGTMFILTVEMLVSVITRSAIVSIAVPFVLLFIPSFIGNLGSASGILGLLPDQLLQIGNTVRFFNAYEIGKTVVGALPILFVLYSILLLLIIPIIYKLYRKSEVS